MGGRRGSNMGGTTAFTEDPLWEGNIGRGREQVPRGAREGGPEVGGEGVPRLGISGGGPKIGSQPEKCQLSSATQQRVAGTIQSW